MLAEDKAVVAIDQTDRRVQIRLRCRVVEISTVAGSGEAAKAVGRSVESALLARADDVIE